MLQELSRKKAQGVIFHKIDRSTRNHSDWSRLIDLRDFSDIKLYFSADGIDMTTRSGRFVADINMAMSKHYIDNLTEEVKKGLYGRLKQGLYPFKAPIGYLDMGGGKLKEIDPTKAPIIKEAFRLCAEERYTFNKVSAYLAKNGLTTSTGRAYGKSTVSRILHNPFYVGVMEVKNKTFIGKHEKLISTKLFHKTQNILSSKKTLSQGKHDYLYRQLITCDCGKNLIAEKQKGRVYYRCHNRDCLETTIREDRITSFLKKDFNKFKLDDYFIKEIGKRTLAKLGQKNQNQNKFNSTIKLHLANADGRLNKLTDLLLDGSVDKEYYLTKKKNIHMEIANLEDKQAEKLLNFKEIERELKKLLELSTSLYSAYILGNKQEKRLLLKKAFSNLYLINGTLVIEPKEPLSLLLFSSSVLLGGLNQTNTRKLSCQEQIDTIVNKLFEYFTNYRS